MQLQNLWGEETSHLYAQTFSLLESHELKKASFADSFEEYKNRSYLIGHDVEIIDESHNDSMIAIQGPKACEYVKSQEISVLPRFFSIEKGSIFGIDLWISRSLQ